MRGANGGRLRARGAGCGARGARGASGRSRGWARAGGSRGWVTPLGCSSPPASWSTERVVRRYRTGKSRFYPPQPESSPPSSAFAQVGNCRPFAFLAFNSAQLAQLTTNSGVCSMRPLKRIAHPSFPPSGTHVTSPKVSRNEKRRAPEIGTRLIGFVVRGAAFAARLRAVPPPYARSVAFASTHLHAAQPAWGDSCASLRRRPMPCRRLSPRSASQRGPSRSS